MKKALVLFVILVIALSAAASDKGSAAAAFEKMKTLAGTWEGTWQDKTETMTLSVISAGSALMQTDASESMVTMYHLDRDRLMLTHYCAAKNQPRMVAELRPDGSIEFKFLDVTNLADPKAGHMRRMILTMKDADHISQQWFFSQDGKEGPGETFNFTRKK